MTIKLANPEDAAKFELTIEDNETSSFTRMSEDENGVVTITNLNGTPLTLTPHATQCTARFKKLHKDAQVPAYETEGSAGMDLRSVSFCLIAPGCVEIIDTGLALALPKGFEAQIRPRSGLAAKHGITVLNSPGTIDSDYRGELKVILINHDRYKPFTVNIGDRIAQMVIAPVIQLPVLEVDELDETGRGEGGLGSTGVK